MADLNLAGERRTFGRAIELRAADNTVDVSGHAAVFNQEADICGMFREIIMPGAFRSTIMQDDVPLLIEHDGLPLARSTMGRGTLKLAEDDVGLRVDSSLDATDPDVMRLVPKMRRGDLNKMSFAFMATRQEWDDTGDTPLRRIMECRLCDVSIVTMPAYDGTDIGLRSLQAWRVAQVPPPNNRVPVIATRLRMRHAMRTRQIGSAASRS
jgi:HK97 family phage prohead protease